MYGKGIYLAENASKSDEYAGDRPTERPPGNLPTLVRDAYLLVCHGRAAYCADSVRINFGSQRRKR